MSSNALDMRRVSRRFRAGIDGCSAVVTALREVSLRVARGECVGVCGPSGAGKTTLLLVAAGLLSPDAGAVWRASAEWVDEASDALGFLTVRGALEYALSQRELAGRSCDGDLAAILERAELAEVAGSRVGQLTAGFRARLRVAHALLARPALLCIDEPLAGIGPVERRRYATFLASLQRDGMALLLSARHRALLAPVAARVVTLDAGRLLDASEDPGAIELHVRTPIAAAGILASHLTGVERRGRTLRVPLARASAEEILSTCLALGIRVRGSRIVSAGPPGRVAEPDAHEELDDAS
ncbi:MAG: ATP-binding cassette domain-containing protein [Gemmatimonadetes bacterium]|nr:ATP-binding cassette domain-containing protein [Gemmatimonadota bacterium]MBI3568319.1 ATP-binding cassette domain-containing protein [Gemmatimonadota bacterium]